jgi:hypothetical protein
MCLVRGIGTAQVLASIFIGICNFFSGLIVRPQQMSKCGKHRKICLTRPVRSSITVAIYAQLDFGNSHIGSIPAILYTKDCVCPCSRKIAGL